MTDPEKSLLALNLADHRRRYYEQEYQKAWQELYDQVKEGDIVGDLRLVERLENILTFHNGKDETIVYLKEV